MLEDETPVDSRSPDADAGASYLRSVSAVPPSCPVVQPSCPAAPASCPAAQPSCFAVLEASGAASCLLGGNVLVAGGAWGV